MQSLTEARCSREGENTASDKGSEGHQIRYESPWFAAASALQGDRAASNRARRALTCVAAALRRPQRVGHSSSCSAGRRRCRCACRDHWPVRPFVLTSISAYSASFRAIGFAKGC